MKPPRLSSAWLQVLNEEDFEVELDTGRAPSFHDEDYLGPGDLEETKVDEFIYTRNSNK